MLKSISEKIKDSIKDIKKLLYNEYRETGKTKFLINAINSEWENYDYRMWKYLPVLIVAHEGIKRKLIQDKGLCSQKIRTLDEFLAREDMDNKYPVFENETIFLLIEKYF